jgi:hypothetical protein
MITDPMRKLLTWIALSALVLASWVALVGAATFATAQPDLSVAVIAPRGAAVEIAVTAGGRLVDAGNYVAIARSSEPGFVLRLYRAGALLVVDARVAEGCRGIVRQARSALRL